MDQIPYALVQRACFQAAERGEDWMVCEIDHQDDRRLEAHPLDYRDDPEFEAFCGEIVMIFYPDGTTD